MASCNLSKEEDYGSKTVLEQKEVDGGMSIHSIYLSSII